MLSNKQWLWKAVTNISSVLASKTLFFAYLWQKYGSQRNRAVASQFSLQREAAYCSDNLLQTINVWEGSFWDRKNNPQPEESISHDWRKRFLPESFSSTWLYGRVTGTKQTGFSESISLCCSGKLVTAGTVTGFQVALICSSSDQWMTTVIGLEGLQDSQHRHLCWGGCTGKKNHGQRVVGEKREQMWVQANALLAGKEKWGQEPISRSSTICWIMFAYKKY